MARFIQESLRCSSVGLRWLVSYRRVYGVLVARFIQESLRCSSVGLRWLVSYRRVYGVLV